MRKFPVFFVCVGFAANPALAQLNSTNKILPSCAVNERPQSSYFHILIIQVQCMTELSSVVPETSVSETYICANQTLGYNLELCVSATCTIREALGMFSYESFRDV
jgi:hypothetical protein